MRKIVWLVLIMVGLMMACSKPEPRKDPWLNPCSILDVQNLELHLQLDTNADWQFSIQSFIQHLPLRTERTGSIYRVKVDRSLGVVEGPAFLAIKSEEELFTYRVNLVNSGNPRIDQKDYRSPKTVNPDSSLEHQRIIHQIDRWRNLHPMPNYSDFFHEETVFLGSKAGTYRAQKDKPITAFYIQPGSSRSIPIQVTYNKTINRFAAEVGPLFDAFDNVVANGTVVRFLVKTPQRNLMMETRLWNGFSQVQFPPQTRAPLEVYAQIDDLKSETLKIALE